MSWPFLFKEMCPQSILPHAGNKINEFRCYEAKIEESEKLVQWQSTGGSSQRCPKEMWFVDCL